MPTATYPEIFCGLFYRLNLMLRICVQNLKFVVLPVPEIIGGTPTSWKVYGYAHAPSLQILNGHLFVWNP